MNGPNGDSHLKPTIFEAYAEEAVKQAVVDRLADGTYSTEVPDCAGVIAFGSDEREVLSELRSVVEEWAELGAELGDQLPILGRVDPNTRPERRLANR